MNNSITVKNKTYWKQDFITAYVWCFGETKKKASAVWRICVEELNFGYIMNIVEDYKHQCHLTFYYD